MAPKDWRHVGWKFPEFVFFYNLKILKIIFSLKLLGGILHDAINIRDR